MPGTVFALANQKGGVGKTTTAVNLAACLAEAGERTLVVDLDPQANATSGLGERANGTSSYDLLDGASVQELAHSTRFANLDLVPSRPDLAGAVVELARLGNGETFLSESLRPSREAYSFVFVDCPPSLGPLTVNALAAVDRVLVPIQCEYYALEGLAQLLDSVDRVRVRLNPRLTVAGLLLTMVDRRTRLTADVAREVRESFGDLVFEAVVPRSVRLAEAPSYGLPITVYAPCLFGCRCVLQGGERACRARLAPRKAVAGSAAGSRSCSAESRTTPSWRNSPWERSARTDSNRAGASIPRRSRASPSRSGSRVWSSRSLSGRSPTVPTS